MSKLAKIARYWHTLRYLKPVQFYGRAWFKLARPTPDLSETPQLRAPSGIWQYSARRTASLTGPDEFFFLGETGNLSKVGWDGPERDKLWRYNQHYFDDLNAENANTRREWHNTLLADWPQNNQPGKGNGWEPYPTSLRIVNWIKWSMAGNQLPDKCIDSLAVQVRWLTKRLEIHLLGNHLFSNAKALVFAGLFFSGKEADQWLAQGLKIIRRELSEQILQDGGHFERSTMYHTLAFEDLLDLINITNSYQSALSNQQCQQIEHWPGTARKMRRWMEVMLHPDGEISFFNDATFGISPTIAEMRKYSSRMEIDAGDTLQDVEWLEVSGYARLANKSAVALLDMAAIGPDYLPGHAHADTLSFELSLFKQRILVNSGISCYGTSDERHRQRGTAAHNTLVINSENSSEVWSGFRVARRARPIDPAISNASPVKASCAHSGYQRLPGKPLHKREWSLNEDSFIIEDIVTGKYQTAETRFHFHPDVEISVNTDAKSGTGSLPNGKQFSWQASCETAKLATSTWHPGFGEAVENFCLVLQLQDGHSQLQLNWPTTK